MGCRLVKAATTSPVPSLPDVSLTLAHSLSTGLPALDRLLPGGGWPLGDVTELVAPKALWAEALDLLLPALSALSWESQWLVWVAPTAHLDPGHLAAQGFDVSRVLVLHPHPVLTAVAQAKGILGAGTAAAVVVHDDGRAPGEEWRTLRRAAQCRQVPVFALRPPRLETPGPATAALGLSLERGAAHLAIQVLHSPCSPGSTVVLAPSAPLALGA
ncbi:MAG: SulA-like leucine-rich domain-containing protein [Candidatus Competibacterales bacterium]